MPADILDLVADGLSYEQIIARHGEFSYRDVFEAADLAANLMRAVARDVPHGEILKLVRAGRKARRTAPARHGTWPKAPELEAIRRTHPRAYEPWTPEEERTLVRAYEAGQTVKRIAADHGRKPGAIRSRLTRLGLVKG